MYLPCLLRFCQELPHFRACFGILGNDVLPAFVVGDLQELLLLSLEED